MAKSTRAVVSWEVGHKDADIILRQVRHTKTKTTEFIQTKEFPGIGVHEARALAEHLLAARNIITGGKLTIIDGEQLNDSKKRKKLTLD